MPISKLEVEYIAKAHKAFAEENLKLCLIYLKKVIEWDFPTTNLLVDCAYLLWKTDYLVSFKENDSLELVKYSFNRVVDGSIPATCIRAMDYIQISHIYLIEGNLHGALSILNIASSRGYLEDPLIVTQSSTILKKIGKSRNIRESMSFLVSAVKLLASKTPYNKIHKEIPYLPGSKLPLSYVYLHCVSHTMKLIVSPSTKPYEKDAYKAQLKSMLVESHYLYTIHYDENILNLMKWINNKDLWIQIGDALETTPFILLMIESYWEGYLRAPLENKSIEMAINGMRKYNLDNSHILNMLEEGMTVNPWNLYIREQLTAYEKEKVTSSQTTLRTSTKPMGKWTKLYNFQKKKCTKLQAFYRGFCIRKIWDDVLQPEYALTKKRFIQSKSLALIKYDEVYFRFHCFLIQRWKKYVSDYKALKQASALLIQTHTRRYLQQIVFFRQLEHVKSVNATYLTACFRVYCLRLSQVFQRWSARFYQAYQNKAADIVRNVIVAGGYNQVFVKGVQQLTAIYRIRKKYMYVKCYRHWLQRYRKRRKKHAKMTIRFFVRNIYRQYYEKQQDMKLKEIERKLKAKHDERLAANGEAADDDQSMDGSIYGGMGGDDQTSVSSQSIATADSRQYYMKHYFPILELFFKKWMEEYNKRVNTRQFERAVLSLQCRFRLLKAKKVVHNRVIRKECQQAYVKHRRFRKQLDIFRPWYLASKVLIIQRNFRIYEAKQKMQRLVHINSEMKLKLSRKYRNLRERFMFYWKKFIYLRKREKLRAKNCILKHYRYYKYFYFPLKRIYRHRFFSLVFKEQVYLRMIGHGFYTLKIQTTKQTQFNSVNGIFQVFTKFYCYHGFQQWKEQAQKQQFVHNWLASWRVRKLRSKILLGNLIGSGSMLCAVNRHYSGVISKLNAESIDANSQNGSSGVTLSTPNSSPNGSRKRNSVSYNLLSRRLSYQSNYPWETNISRSKVLANISQRLLFDYLFHWNQLYRLRHRISYFRSSAVALNTFQTILDGISLRQICSIKIQRQMRRYLSYHNIYLPNFYVARIAEELKQKALQKSLCHAFSHYLKHFQNVMEAKAKIQRFLVRQHERQKRLEQQQHFRNALSFLHSPRSKFFQRVVRSTLVHWMKRFCEQVVQQKVATTNFLTRYEKMQKYKLGESKKRNLSKKKSPHDYYCNNASDQEDDDVAFLRLQKIEEYQQRLEKRSNAMEQDKSQKKLPFSTGKHHTSQLYSKSTPSFTAIDPVQFSGTMNSPFSSKKPKKHAQVVEALAATPLYFQSEAFHTLYYQLKASQGFLVLSCDNLAIQGDPSVVSTELSTNAKKTAKSISRKDLHHNPKKLMAALTAPTTINSSSTLMIALQESYFLLQQTKQLVVQLNDQNQSLLFQSICESFEGESLFFYQGEVFDAYFVVYLEDFLSPTRQKFYSTQKFDKSLWPLTLPSRFPKKILFEQAEVKEDLKSIVLHFQEVMISITNMILFCHVLQLSSKLANQVLATKSTEDYSGNLSASSSAKLNPSSILSPIEEKFYPHCYLRHVRELKMDIQSTGQLGICVLFHSIQYCPHLKTLIITNDIPLSNEKHSPNSSFATALSSALVALSKASSLQDFRYYGIFSQCILEGLQAPLQRNFNGLQKLCFSVLREDIQYADALIQIGKQRAFSSIQSGISISVDVHN